jgi:hypothetical protein
MFERKRERERERKNNAALLKNLYLRFAKCKTSGIISKVKKSFLVWLKTWFGKKKKKFFWGGVFLFSGILPKNRFFRLFSAKIGPYATSSIYSESSQKTHIHFFDF